MVELSITIPIYNEEESIERTVKNLVKELNENNVDYEFVLINHGSEDKTEKIINKLSKENKKIKAINLAKNLGYGGGIMYGLDNSKGKFIGWACADEEVSANDVVKVFLQLKNKDCAVVKALRKKRKDGLIRIITTKIFNFLVKIRFNMNLEDVNGHPLFMKKEVYENIKVNEKEHLFNLDLLLNITAGKFKIIEIPVIHKKRGAGKSFMKPKRIFEMGFDFLKYST